MLFSYFQPFSAGSTGSTGSVNYAPADDEKMFVIGHGGQARVAVKNHDASEWSVGTYM